MRTSSSRRCPIRIGPVPSASPSPTGFLGGRSARPVGARRDDGLSSRLHRALAIERMRRSLASADAIVMNTPEAGKRLTETFPDFSRKIVAVVPNGWDADDFSEPAPVRSDDAFRIVHTGYLHTELGLQHQQRRRLRRLLGGEIVAVDILTRSHVFLLQALEQLVSNGGPEDRAPSVRAYIGRGREKCFEGVATCVHARLHHAHGAVTRMRSAICCSFRCTIFSRHPRTIVPGKNIRVTSPRSGRSWRSSGRGRA